MWDAFADWSPHSHASLSRHQLPPGRYAAIVIHDEDDNGRLDTNPMGVPGEGYGVSNDARGFLSAPSFEPAAIAVGDADIATVDRYPAHSPRLALAMRAAGCGQPTATSRSALSSPIVRRTGRKQSSEGILLFTAMHPNYRRTQEFGICRACKPTDRGSAAEPD